MLGSGNFLADLKSSEHQHYFNLGSKSLAELSVSRGETDLMESGAILLNTSPHTGRAPQDRFLVKYQSSLKDIYGSEVNKPVDNEQSDLLLLDVEKYLCNRDLFIMDRYACSDVSQRTSDS